jgi:hypothetical protein
MYKSQQLYDDISTKNLSITVSFIALVAKQPSDSVHWGTANDMPAPFISITFPFLLVIPQHSQIHHSMKINHQ